MDCIVVSVSFCSGMFVFLDGCVEFASPAKVDSAFARPAFYPLVVVVPRALLKVPKAGRVPGPLDLGAGDEGALDWRLIIHSSCLPYGDGQRLRPLGA